MDMLLSHIEDSSFRYDLPVAFRWLLESDNG